jgi:hypothetical protein
MRGEPGVGRCAVCAGVVAAVKSETIHGFADLGE